MLKLVALLTFVTVAYAALARYPPQEKPAQFANQEGCYIRSLNRVLPYDKPYYSGTACDKYTCVKSSNETRWETCGAIAIQPGCRKSEVDLSKNYPDCCPQEVCD